MKHLKKYNEDLEHLEHSSYINACFIDFIDDNSAHFFTDGLNFVGIEVLVPQNDMYKIGLGDVSNSFDKDIIYCDVLKDFYSELDSSIEKVKVKYPYIQIDIPRYKDQISIEIRFML